MTKIEQRAERSLVLVAEANAELREYMRRLLALSYEVEAVADGQAALEAVQRRRPALVLVDVMLPRLDGYALLRMLRADPHLTTVPVVLLSMRVDEESGTAAMVAAADDYLLKPFSARELLARVAAQVELGQLRQQVQRTEVREDARHWLTAIVESSGDAIVSTDLEGRITTWNSGAEKTLGYHAAEMIGRHITFVTVPERIGNVSGYLERLARGESIRQNESEWLSKTGQRIPVSVSTFPIRDDANQIIGTSGIIRDISELKQAHAHVRRLIDSNILSILCGDQYGHITEANDACLALIGYTREELLSGKINWMDMSPPEYRAADARALEEILATGTCRPYEKEYVRKDGSRVPILIAAASLDETRGQAVAFVLDLTERKRAEEALHDRIKLQDRIAKVAAVVPGAIVSYRLRPDGSGCMPYASAALVDIYGLHPDEVREDASPITSRVHPDDLERIQATFAECVRTLQPWRGEFRVCHPSKGVIWVDGYGLPQPEPDGGILWQGYLSDITEKVNARHALEAARATAERANDAKTRFLAAASHDLRQPLQGLRLLLTAFRQGLNDPVQACEICTLMDESLTSSEKMLSRLMEFAALESGNVTVKLEQLQLDELVRQLARQSNAEAAAKGLQLRVRTIACATYSDPVLLERILRNLMTNALRYTQTGGALIAIRRRSGRLRIEVRDTGIGIPGDKRELVFEEFRQLGNPERDRSKGAGLGLAIVARTAGLLGHALSMDSTEGRGSVFAIEVPEVVIRQPKVDAYPDRAMLVHRAKILVIEDDPAQSAALKMLLTHMGYEVQVARDAPMAMQAIQRHDRAPNLILSDYRLPGSVSGIDLIGDARVAAGCDIPAILITGDIHDHVQTAAQAARCVVLKKPYALADLETLIDMALAPAPG